MSINNKKRAAWLRAEAVAISDSNFFVLIAQRIKAFLTKTFGGNPAPVAHPTAEPSQADTTKGQTQRFKDQVKDSLQSWINQVSEALTSLMTPMLAPAKKAMTAGVKAAAAKMKAATPSPKHHPKGLKKLTTDAEKIAEAEKHAVDVIESAYTPATLGVAANEAINTVVTGTPIGTVISEELHPLMQPAEEPTPKTKEPKPTPQRTSHEEDGLQLLVRLTNAIMIQKGINQHPMFTTFESKVQSMITAMLTSPEARSAIDSVIAQTLQSAKQDASSQLLEKCGFFARNNAMRPAPGFSVVREEDLGFN